MLGPAELPHYAAGYIISPTISEEDQLKYWISLALLPVLDCLALAHHADGLGFAGVTLPDHAVRPDAVQAPYPGDPTGTFGVPNEAPFPSCWVLIAAMAAQTSSLRFATTVSVLPMRDPLLTAKEIATAACIAPGRIVVGAGVGWMSDEFAVLGQSFADRGRRTDEIIEILRQAWRDGVVEHRGPSYTIPKVHLHPRPPSPVPIWIGGGSDAALRRAARIGDGFISEGYFDTVTRLIRRLKVLREEHDTSQRPFEITVSTVGRAGGDWPDEADVERMKSLGVAGIKICPWPGAVGDTTLAEKKRALDRLARDLL